MCIRFFHYGIILGLLSLLTGCQTAEPEIWVQSRRGQSSAELVFISRQEVIAFLHDADIKTLCRAKSDWFIYSGYKKTSEGVEFTCRGFGSNTHYRIHATDSLDGVCVIVSGTQTDLGHLFRESRRMTLSCYSREEYLRYIVQLLLKRHPKACCVKSDEQVHEELEPEPIHSAGNK